MSASFVVLLGLIYVDYEAAGQAGQGLADDARDLLDVESSRQRENADGGHD